MQTMTAAAGLQGHTKARRARRMRTATRTARPVVLDFRRAMGAEDRFYRLSAALADLRTAMRNEQTAHVIWPLDSDVSVAGALLARPLGQTIVELSGPGQVVIHTKGGVCTEFTRLVPRDNVSFVVHMNAEEAAMRWERHDAAPARRIRVAEKLREAGWKVQICVGAVRFVPGWKDDYTELFRQLAVAGFSDLLFRFESDRFDEFISGTPCASTKARTYFLELAAKLLAAGKDGVNRESTRPLDWFDRSAA